MDTRSRKSLAQRIRGTPSKTVATLKLEAVKRNLKQLQQHSSGSSSRSLSPVKANMPAAAVAGVGDLGGENALRLRVFNGTSEVKEFFKRFEIASAAKGLDEAAKCLWLPVYLSGPAMAHYESYNVSQILPSNLVVTRNTVLGP